MSSLIFYSDAEQGLVVTDTLAVTPDGSPMLFTSKAHYLPHLKTIIAGTGLGGFSGDWAMSANNRMVVRGIENLDYHTPDALRKLWATFRKEYSLPSEATTTVYQWGFSEESDSVAGYAYRSTDDFTSERLNYGIGVKPECAVPEGNLFDNLESMMHEQRSIQNARPAGSRLFIGGEAIVIHLTREACVFKRVFEFPEFKSQEADIFRAFSIYRSGA